MSANDQLLLGAAQFLIGGFNLLVALLQFLILRHLPLRHQASLHALHGALAAAAREQPEPSHEERVHRRAVEEVEQSLLCHQ